VHAGEHDRDLQEGLAPVKIGIFGERHVAIGLQGLGLCEELVQPFLLDGIAGEPLGVRAVLVDPVLEPALDLVGYARLGGEHELKLIGSQCRGGARDVLGLEEGPSVGGSDVGLNRVLGIASADVADRQQNRQHAETPTHL